MRAYMVYAGDPQEGAVLAVADNGQQAKAVGGRLIMDWTDCQYIDVRVKWLREANMPWVLQRYGQPTLPGFDPKPFAVDKLDCCESCKQWNPYPLADALCRECDEERERDERWRDHYADSGIRQPWPA